MFSRLNRLKNPFEKESTEAGNWTREVYRIKSVNLSHERAMFKVVDVNGRLVTGQIYAEELQSIVMDPNGLFEIEEVTKQEQRPDGLWKLVKWRGCPSSQMTWVPASIIQDVREGTSLPLMP